MSVIRDLNFKAANHCIASFNAGAGDPLGAEIIVLTVTHLL